MTSTDENFYSFMNIVDSIIQNATGGLTSEDIADKNYRDYHEAGMSPEDTAEEVLGEEGFGDF